MLNDPCPARLRFGSSLTTIKVLPKSSAYSISFFTILWIKICLRNAHNHEFTVFYSFCHTVDHMTLKPSFNKISMRFFTSHVRIVIQSVQWALIKTSILHRLSKRRILYQQETCTEHWQSLFYTPNCNLSLILTFSVFWSKDTTSNRKSRFH